MILVVYIFMLFLNVMSALLLNIDKISIGTYLIISNINIFGFFICYILDKISDYMGRLAVSIGKI